MRPLLLAALLTSTGHAGQDGDWRDLQQGTVLVDSGYADQPLARTLADGSWLVVLTTGRGVEGTRGQHVVSLRSEDQGRTWSAPASIEPAHGPEASWAQPLVAPSGRVFVFYIYNDTDITDRRADLLGSIVMRWSDDDGRTWSERHPLPLRTTKIDRENDFGGKVRMQWGVSQAQVQAGAVLLPFTKIGKYLVDETEAWFLRSDDLLTIVDPASASWTLRPDGDVGVRGAGPINSEPDLAILPDGSLATVLRTVAGHMLLATSSDGARTWSTPRPLEDEHGVPIRHPRACPRLWHLGGNRYLLWCHENGATDWAPGTRNPAWVRGGVWRDGSLRFGPAEILLYDRDPQVRISYPDLILDGDAAFVLATEKHAARCHRIAPGFLQALFDGLPADLQGTRGWIGSGKAGGRVMPPKLPPTSWSFVGLVEPPGDGRLPMMIADATVGGRGLTLRLGEELELVLELHGEGGTRVIRSQPDALAPGAAHQVAVLLDGGPGIVRWMVDGRVLDGGDTADRGWSWIAEESSGRDEKFLFEGDRARELLLANGSRFQLAAPDGDNALVVAVGARGRLELPFGEALRLGIVTTGVGFQPHPEDSFPASGVVRLVYADGFEQESTWDLRDSNGQGRGAEAQPIGEDWSLVDARAGKRWDGRKMWWQPLEADETRQLIALEFDLELTVDAAGDDAEFAVLAIAATGAGAVSGTPLAPLSVPTSAWNADVFAVNQGDDAGRGFRERGSARRDRLPEALQVLPLTPLRLGRGTSVGAHFTRALMAREVIALIGK
ncbi:MAG: sialidase family protein [Planctomycetota bacterium]|nr:sialidase family protein [Planctomycetota bacterium]